MFMKLIAIIIVGAEVRLGKTAGVRAAQVLKTALSLSSKGLLAVLNTKTASLEVFKWYLAGLLVE